MTPFPTHDALLVADSPLALNALTTSDSANAISMVCSSFDKRTLWLGLMRVSREQRPEELKGSHWEQHPQHVQQHVASDFTLSLEALSSYVTEKSGW